MPSVLEGMCVSRGGGGGGVNGPTLHAEAGCLRAGAALFPDIDVAGYDSATFFCIETACDEGDGVACDGVEDVEGVSG